MEELKAIITAFFGKLSSILDTLLSLTREDEIEGIIETYEVTAKTQHKVIWPPIKPDRKTRHKWLWVEVINDSETVDVRIGVNAGEASSLIVYAGETYKVEFRDRKKIKFLNYKTDSGEAAIRIIGAY